MRSAKFFEQLRVRSALLERIQLLPMKVLQQRIAQEYVVVRVPDDGWNRGEACLLSGPQAALTHDKLVTVTGRSDDDGLQEADLAQRVGKFGERGLVKHLARLLGVGCNGLD
jgi:hypothetical protein